MAISLPIVSTFNKKGLTKAQKALRGFSRGVGAAATAAAASFAAIGGAAARMASEFEDNFAKIEGLVGVTGDQLGELEEAARRLGPEFGKSANEAADALFFITSAGLRGAEATEVLEASLKGAAIGLGETKTIADLATSAVNAYGSSQLSGAKAVDVLTEAVRLGKLEPEALAQSMGMVLPLASNLGVSFAEVGAAMAGMSKTGTDASTASTQLRQILTTIAKPTAEADRALANMGMSAAGIREQIEKEGLFAALETLTDAFDGNIEATTEVFGNVRALSGVLDLMGASVDDNRELFKKMTDDVGVLDDALGVTEETASFKFTKAMETLKASLLPVGDILLGIGTDLLEQFTPLIEDFGPGLLGVFEGLAPILQAVAAQLPLLFEALAPVVPIFAKLGEVVGDVLVTAMPVLLNAIQMFVPVLELLMPVLDIVVGLFETIIGPVEFLTGLLGPLIETFLPLVTEAFTFLGDSVQGFADNLAPINDTLLPVFDDFVANTVSPTIDNMRDRLRSATENGFQYLVDQGILPSSFALEEWAGNADTQSKSYATVIVSRLNLVIQAINATAEAFVRLNNMFVDAVESLPGDLQGGTRLTFTPIPTIDPDVSPRVEVPSAADFSATDTSPLAARFLEAQERAAEVARLQAMIAGRDTGFQRGAREGVRGDFVVTPFADGGIVRSPRIGLVGEAGPEAIIPLDRAGGLGSTYNITVQAGVGDPVRIGEEVVTAIKRYERASGPVFARA